MSNQSPQELTNVDNLNPVNEGIIDLDRQNYGVIPPQMNFQGDWMEAHLQKFSIRVRLDKTAICPNVVGDVDKLQHDPNCKLCDNGFYHYDPIECSVIFQQDQLMKQFLKEGVFEPGHAIMTFPMATEKGDPIYIYPFDRVVLLRQPELFNQVLNKSQGEVDVLRYHALKVTCLLDSRGNRYTQGIQFNLDQYGNIQWIEGQSRPLNKVREGFGEVMTIVYLYRPVYRILELLHEGRFSEKLIAQNKLISQRLPQQCLVKKDYYVTKKDIERAAFKAPVQPETFLYNTLAPPPAF